jgi:hypothetical protein
MTQPTPDKIKLTKRIEGLFVSAKEFPGQAFRCQLKNGLRIAIKIEGHDTRLQLSRVGDAGPADHELETCLKHWPGGAPTTITDALSKAHRFTNKGEHFLRTHWPTVEQRSLLNTMPEY